MRVSVPSLLHTRVLHNVEWRTRNREHITSLFASCCNWCLRRGPTVFYETTVCLTGIIVRFENRYSQLFDRISPHRTLRAKLPVPLPLPREGFSQQTVFHCVLANFFHVVYGSSIRTRNELPASVPQFNVIERVSVRSERLQLLCDIFSLIYKCKS